LKGGGYVLHTYAPEQIYLYVLIGCAVLAFLLLLFGDIFDFDGPVDPMLIIPWFAFTSLFGYLGETFLSGYSLLLFVISGCLATGLVFLLNFYVLIPMRNAEATLSSSEKDFEGRIATVLTPIPCEGMGEIQLTSVTGSSNRPATAFQPIDEPLAAGSKVLIIEVKERVCYVVPYTKKFLDN
jgi:hypothetical protein